MPKFRKKPVVVSAEQFWPTVRPWPEGVYFDDLGTEFTRPNYRIITLEGEMKITPGDWIITGVKNEKYPCKPDIFEETYERVDG